MGLPIFLFEMGAGQFSSQGPIRVWSMCPLFEGECHLDILEETILFSRNRVWDDDAVRLHRDLLQRDNLVGLLLLLLLVQLDTALELL